MMLKRLFSKPVFSWAMYDWANSAYTTTVMAAFFPIFFKNFWNTGVDATTSTFRLGLANSIGSLIIVLLAPALGAIADKVNAKKKLLFASAVLGSLSTIALAFIPQGAWQIAGLTYMFSLVVFSASILFYDALLPNVSTESDIDFISSAGYALGYLGGGVLLVLNVLMYQNPHWFALADGTAGVKAAFVSVGIWWALFSIPLLLFVPEKPQRLEKSIGLYVKEGFSNVFSTAKKIFRSKEVFVFLCAYWLYIDGVLTIVKMSVDYGVSLGFKTGDLISALLIVQFVGFPAGFVFGYLGQKWNLKYSLLIGLAFYVGVTIFAIRMTNVQEFYVMATVIGLVQGSVQALSRSLFSRLIPTGHEGEFFGFFSLVGKAASIIGPALMAFVTYLTGDNRLGLLSLLVILISGALILAFQVRVPRKS